MKKPAVPALCAGTAGFFITIQMLLHVVCQLVHDDRGCQEENIVGAGFDLDAVDVSQIVVVAASSSKHLCHPLLWGRQLPLFESEPRALSTQVSLGHIHTQAHMILQ